MCTTIICATNIFQSTLSMRRATAPGPTPGMGTQFQSTLSMRRATQSDGPLPASTDFNPRSP